MLNHRASPLNLRPKPHRTSPWITQSPEALSCLESSFTRDASSSPTPSERRNSHVHRRSPHWASWQVNPRPLGLQTRAFFVAGLRAIRWQGAPTMSQHQSFRITDFSLRDLPWAVAAFLVLSVVSIGLGLLLESLPSVWSGVLLGTSGALLVASFLLRSVKKADRTDSK